MGKARFSPCVEKICDCTERIAFHGQGQDTSQIPIHERNVSCTVERNTSVRSDRRCVLHDAPWALQRRDDGTLLGVDDGGSFQVALVDMWYTKLSLIFDTSVMRHKSKERALLAHCGSKPRIGSSGVNSCCAVTASPATVPCLFSQHCPQLLFWHSVPCPCTLPKQLRDASRKNRSRCANTWIRMLSTE